MGEVLLRSCGLCGKNEATCRMPPRVNGFGVNAALIGSRSAFQRTLNISCRLCLTKFLHCAAVIFKNLIMYNYLHSLYSLGH